MDLDKKNMIEVKIKKDFFDKREVVKKNRESFKQLWFGQEIYWKYD